MLIFLDFCQILKLISNLTRCWDGVIIWNCINLVLGSCYICFLNRKDGILIVIYKNIYMDRNYYTYVPFINILRKKMFHFCIIAVNEILVWNPNFGGGGEVWKVYVLYMCENVDNYGWPPNIQGTAIGVLHLISLLSHVNADIYLYARSWPSHAR